MFSFFALVAVLGVVAMQSRAVHDFLPAHLAALTSGLFIEKGVAPEELNTAYAKRPIRILVVAGHDAEFSGAVFNGLVEADLTLELANRLFQLFFADKHFLASRSRTTYGYTTDFVAVFNSTEGQAGIAAFREKARSLMQTARREGAFTKNAAVHHPAASNDISSRLYGINQWANTHESDIVLHIHFNDYPGRPKGAPGRYSGMSIYIPERQLPNAVSSRAVAENMRAALAPFVTQSNFPPEQDGIVEDQ
ncbi:MAG: N-acetylmuramoyl-L-alanine amidase, partial [Parcubacteria group bacterium]|nr:N-acetylmuramoyl-L-alanine amidase [Parcubacteria group bacterium]